MSNVLESYLVSLGFEIKNNELKKFDLALKQAGASATTHTSGIAQQFLKLQTSIVGGFAAIGLATIGMMDKVADADLGYQQLGRQMFTSTAVARRMSQSLKILGITLADATWNPELRERYNQLNAQQKRQEQALGIGADTEMKLRRIRDIEFQLRRVQTTLADVAISLTTKLYDALGGDRFLDKAKGWADWVEQHAPQITDWLRDHLVVVLKDARVVMADVWRVTEKLASAFLRLVGAISGDDSLRDGKLNFESFGKAIDQVANGLVAFIDSVTSAELVVIDLATGVVDLVRALKDLLSLNMSGFGKDLKHLGADLGMAGGDFKAGGVGGAAVLGTGLLGAMLGAKTIGGVGRGLLSAGRAGSGGVIEGAGAGGLLGALGLGAAGVGLAAFADSQANRNMGEWGWQHVGKKLGLPDLSGFGKREEAWENQFAPLRWLNTLGQGGATSSVASSGGSSVDPITAAAARYGISPDVARAVAARESGGRQFDSHGNLIKNTRSGAMGMFQLMANTAKSYGVDPTSLMGNVEGGVHLLSDLLKHYGGNLREALAGYNWGSGNLDRAMRRHGGFSLSYLPKETQDYIRNIEGRLGGGEGQASVVVNIQHMNATPDQVKAAVRDGVAEAQRRQARTHMLNTLPVHG